MRSDRYTAPLTKRKHSDATLYAPMTGPMRDAPTPWACRWATPAVHAAVAHREDDRGDEQDDQRAADAPPVRNVPRGHREMSTVPTTASTAAVATAKPTASSR